MTNPRSESGQLLRDAGAVIQTGFDGLTAPDWLLRGLAAGEIGGAVLFHRNIADPARLAALTGSLYRANPDLLITIDEEGGDVTRLEIAEGSSYPGNLALGHADDPDLTEAVARAIGLDLAAAGVNLNYAPVADVNANPDNPVIGVRSFGSDSALVSRHTAAYVRGLQSTGVIGCAKHFPGHGDTNGDSHLGLPRIDFDDATLALHLAPFRAAIDAGVKAIMTAHILVPRYNAAVPATMAPEVMTGLLRTELGFDGLIVTDGIDMAAISAYYGVAEGTVKAVAAGVDAICAGGSLYTEEAFRHLRDALVWAVREGRLSEERLHEAAERNRAAARWSAEARGVGSGIDSRSTPADAAANVRARVVVSSSGAGATPTSAATSTVAGSGSGAGAGSGAVAGADAASALDCASGPGSSSADVSHRAIGLTAARRAIRVRGDLRPLTAPAHVVEFSSIASIAVDALTPWGVADALTALLPGSTSTNVQPVTHLESVGLMTVPVVDEDADTDLEPLLTAATGRPLVLAFRDLHRSSWAAHAVNALLAARPDAVLVEMGVPYGLVDELATRGVTVLATHGSARVCGIAAAEKLVGATAE